MTAGAPLPDDGIEAWAVVQARGYEGLVAKDPRAPYRPCPTSSWRKVKVRHEGRFLVGGMAMTASGYTGLLLGARVGRELRYVGTVEWGVRRGVLEALVKGARLRDDSPFTDVRGWRGVTWLEPT